MKNCPNCGAILKTETSECEFCSFKHKVTVKELLKTKKAVISISAIMFIVVSVITFAIIVLQIFAPADPESVRQAAFSRFVSGNYDAKISYRDLDRNTDNYAAKLVKYRGVIIESMPATIQSDVCLADDSTEFYRVSVAGGGEYDLLWVESSQKTAIPDELCDGDWVEIFGVVYGRASYQTVGAGVLSLPAIVAVRMNRIDPFKLIEYPRYAFSVTDFSLRTKVDIDSFEIKTIRINPEDILVNYEIIGVTSSASFRIEALCYDDKGRFIGSQILSGNVVGGERFKLSNAIRLPLGTTLIEFKDAVYVK